MTIVAAVVAAVSMNAQKISQFLQNVLLKSGHHVEVTMMPE